MLGKARDSYNAGVLLLKKKKKKKERKRGETDSPRIFTFIRCYYERSCPFDELHFLEETELSPAQG